MPCELRIHLNPHLVNYTVICKMEGMVLLRSGQTKKLPIPYIMPWNIRDTTQLPFFTADEFLLRKTYVSTEYNYFWCYKCDVRGFFGDNNSSSLWIKKKKLWKCAVKKVKDNLLSKKWLKTVYCSNQIFEIMSSKKEFLPYAFIIRGFRYKTN